MTSVSVAMATYNGAHFLLEQLESIAAQTVLPAELVVTDDASTDDTMEIALRFAERAPFPVRVHRNATRLGYRANFMRNVGLCASRIIAFCDQDDVWDVRKLEHALTPFQDSDVLLSCHEAWVLDETGRRGGLARIYPLPERNPPLSLWPLRNPFGFSILFRRELLQLNDLWHRSVDDMETNNRMAHDQWFFFLASVFGTVVFIDEPLVGYRQHGGNTYGVSEQARTPWRRIAQWVEAARSQYSSFSVAADTRAVLLEELQDRVDEPWRTRARAGVPDYRDLARHCALRSSAFKSASVTTRLGAWLSLLRGGAYAGARWAFGRKTALKDLSCLVLPYRLLNALPRLHTVIANETRADPKVQAPAISVGS